jgi:hypothetical protein
MTYSMTNGALKLGISPGARSSFLVRRNIRADQAVWKRLAIVSFIFDYLARALRSRARLAQRILKIRLTVAFETVRWSLDDIVASGETSKRRFGMKFACACA